MKIILESPFKEIYKFGYVVKNKENRKQVILYNSNKDRTTISYARYLMTTELGHFIPPNLEVDHIDNNKTNDLLCNLQLLTRKENLIKQGEKTRYYHHGTLSCYRYCKCDLCKKVKSDYMKEYNKSKKLNLKHGSIP